MSVSVARVLAALFLPALLATQVREDRSLHPRTRMTAIIDRTGMIVSPGIGVASPQQGVPRVVTGVVRDSARGAIQFAVVESGTGQKVATDDSGAFVLRLPARSAVAIDIRRIGFRPVSLRLPAGGDTALSVVMAPLAQVLPEALVKAAAANRGLELRGFYRRLADRNRGVLNGDFITPEEIDRRKPPRITWMIDGHQGVRVVRTNIYNVLAWEIKGPGGCNMTVYLDGMRLNKLTSATNGMKDYLDVIVSPSSVAGIEIYGRGNRAPPEYQPLAGSCGVVLVWTR